MDTDSNEHAGTEESEEGFTATIRFKAPGTLRARLARLAKRRVKLVPELAREAVVTFVEAEERKAAEGLSDPS